MRSEDGLRQGEVKKYLSELYISIKQIFDLLIYFVIQNPPV